MMSELHKQVATAVPVVAATEPNVRFPAKADIKENPLNYCFRPKADIQKSPVLILNP